VRSFVLTVTALALVGAALACGVGEGHGPSPTPAAGDLSPRPGDERLQRGPVFIDQTSMVEMETYPPQHRLLLRGSLPTPCHRLRATVSRDEAQGVIAVEVYSLVSPDAVCAQVLAPFEASLSLGSATRRYRVLVNGEPVGSIGP
jgi:hypothetical protein